MGYKTGRQEGGKDLIPIHEVIGVTGLEGGMIRIVPARGTI